MGSPIYEAMSAEWNDVRSMAEWRGRAEIRRETIAVLKTMKKPTVAIKGLLAKLEAEESAGR